MCASPARGPDCAWQDCPGPRLQVPAGRPAREHPELDRPCRPHLLVRPAQPHPLPVDQSAADAQERHRPHADDRRAVLPAPRPDAIEDGHAGERTGQGDGERTAVQTHG